ncbi:TetR/AcrR family transcriptional regulator [Nocardioides anomalus]|uniref:TetR/AcrR family transcriptional regulator n=1 Tax=Nocardioides anomalus TaxID=2712223 RepID=A0A6G6WIP7_9ACTN|nr:TetR/AcrR family transcriptional regulator [Nocardioides anomalus]QIG45092.1 TetR/AcrR family transcriptional regulator [Nocardioides anomalus]
MTAEPSPDVRPSESSEPAGRRQLILAAAGRLFATKGYGGTTIRDIAHAAGLTSGSLYHHFDSKEAMLVEVLHEFLDGLVARFERVERQARGPDETLRLLVHDVFRTVHETPDAVALYQHEAPGLRHQPQFVFVEQATGRVEGVLRRAVAAGQERGRFRPDLDQSLTYRFIRDTVWNAVHWYHPDGALGHEELADRYLRMVLSGISARPAPDRAQP